MPRRIRRALAADVRWSAARSRVLPHPWGSGAACTSLYRSRTEVCTVRFWHRAAEPEYRHSCLFPRPSTTARARLSPMADRARKGDPDGGEELPAAAQARGWAKACARSVAEVEPV